VNDTSPVSNLTILSKPEVIPSILPSPEKIVALCKEAGYLDRCALAFTDPSSNAILAWIKYGPNVAVDEALTQAWVADNLNAMPETTGSVKVKAPRVYMAFTSFHPSPACTLGYIVMEYISAPDCTKRDYKRVARAVDALIHIKAPSGAAPGAIGGGPVIHNVFFNWESEVRYETSKELQDHLNRILKRNDNPMRVKFAAEDLYLCPVDIHPGNFKKLDDDTIVALDFRATCFLPESFITYAMEDPVHVFAGKVAKYVNYPRSSNIDAMSAASYYVACNSKKSIDAALPKSIRRRIVQR